MTGICDGRVVIVTGSARGIGRGHATLFAREGAAVFGVDINRAAAEETSRLVAEDGGRFAAHAADVADAPTFAADFATRHQVEGYVGAETKAIKGNACSQIGVHQVGDDRDFLV